MSPAFELQEAVKSGFIVNIQIELESSATPLRIFDTQETMWILPGFPLKNDTVPGTISCESFRQLVGHGRDDEKIVKALPVAIRKDDCRHIR